MVINSNGSEWNVILGDDALGIVEPIADYLRLEVTYNADNEVGHLTLDLPISYASLLTNIGLLPTTGNPCLYNPFQTIAIHRSINCGDFYLEGRQVFFINKPIDALAANKSRTIRIEADESLWHMGKRKANTHAEDPRVEFAAPGTNADDVVHQLFTEFFGAAPPAGARDFIAAGLLSDAGSASLGAPYVTNVAYKDLLSAFQEAAEFSESKCLPFYFGLVPSLTPNPIGQTVSLPLEFQTRFERWGADRTTGNPDGNDPVILSAVRGNVDSTAYSNDFSDDVSVLYFLGEGTGAGQITAVSMNDDAIASSPWAWCESSVSDTEVTDPDVAQSRADSELTRLNAGDEFTATIVGTAGGIYGDPAFGGDWTLGDCITVDYRAAEECSEEEQAVQLDVRNTSTIILIEDCKESITANFTVESCIVCDP